MITFKPIASYYTDDDRAVLSRIADLKAAAKRRQIELAEVDAAIDNRASTDPVPEKQIQNLIDGIEVQRPPPLSAKRTAIQYIIRDIEQALDFMAGKERQLNINAGARLAKDIKPQHDIAAKELADALVIAHDKHLAYWQTKRALINGAIGLHGLFDSNIDDVLGIPVDKGTALHDYFHYAVNAGHIRNVPAALR
jgi:hypothetical protein